MVVKVRWACAMGECWNLMGRNVSCRIGLQAVQARVVALVVEEE
jgi:CO dehydrogenase/acetyl-CoA synthase alpha subunit